MRVWELESESWSTGEPESMQVEDQENLRASELESMRAREQELLRAREPESLTAREHESLSAWERKRGNVRIRDCMPKVAKKTQVPYVYIRLSQKCPFSSDHFVTLRESWIWLSTSRSSEKKFHEMTVRGPTIPPKGTLRYAIKPKKSKLCFRSEIEILL